MTWAILAVAVLLGAAARFYRLGALPPGLYHDEAFNGLDAVRVLEGERPVFFEANNGREPLFLYGMALAMALLGRTPYAVRLAAAVLGTLTVPATFLMARALFDERVGLWSAFIIAVAPWPIHLSRIGLRAVSMPLVVALALWAWWTACRLAGRQRVAWFALSGALFGLSLYTYTAARFVLVAVAITVLFQGWMRPSCLGREELIYLSLAAVLAMVPLIVYGITHWETFVERTAQVSILNPEISHGDPLGMLARNVARAAGLFAFRGDRIPRHNVPLRPLFDPVVSVFFCMGVLSSLVKVRKSAHTLLLVWTGVMLIPTILAEDCPHFLRAVGVLPVAAVYPALGLEWAREHLARRRMGRMGNWMVGAVLGISCVWGGYDYFVRYGGDAGLPHWFEADQVHEAVEINRFLGSGWQGEGVYEPRGEPFPGRHVYLGPRMWEDRLTVNFLVGSPERISILGRDPVQDVDEVLALAWPHGDMSDVREVLPHPARIEVWPGPVERGDLDAEPVLLYVAFGGVRQDAASTALAQFEQGIALLGWDVEPLDDQTRLRLRWRTDRPVAVDYTAFVHLVRDGQVIAQDDRIPGEGFYPTTWWRPGDELVETYVLNVPYEPGRDRIFVGWYELSSMQHLQVLGEKGQPDVDRLELH